MISLKKIVMAEKLNVRTKCLRCISIDPSNNEKIDSAIRNLHWAITFDQFFADPYIYLTHAYTLKMLATFDAGERESFFKKGLDYIETFKKLCPPNTSDNYRFYERNLYEAHGDLLLAKEINQGLHTGDSKSIAALYKTVMEK